MVRILINIHKINSVAFFGRIPGGKKAQLQTLVLSGSALIPMRSCRVFWTARKAVAVESTSRASIASG